MFCTGIASTLYVAKHGEILTHFSFMFFSFSGSMDQFIDMQSIIFTTFISIIELFPAWRQWNFPVFNDAQTRGTELCNQTKTVRRHFLFWPGVTIDWHESIPVFTKLNSFSHHYQNCGVYQMKHTSGWLYPV